MSELVVYYSNSTLYQSKQTYSVDSIQAYLGKIELPTLSDAAKNLLDALLTLEELRMSTRMFPNSKAPGEDSIPIEVCKQYADSMLPKLLTVFNEAKECKRLPLSMTKAIIVLSLKPGKDPLLQNDVKILAMVFAVRLNGVICTIIHSDQAGFMPQKSTVIILHRLFLNMQSKADNMGDIALLSLDAHKAFNSIEWTYLWAILRKFGFKEECFSWVQLLYSN